MKYENNFINNSDILHSKIILAAFNGFSKEKKNYKVFVYLPIIFTLTILLDILYKNGKHLSEEIWISTLGKICFL